MGKYDDIIDLKWTGSTKRSRMDLINRSKIFLPFAALRGFEDAIEAKNKIVVRKEELSDYKKEQLDASFYRIIDELNNKRHPEVKIIYYNEDIKKDIFEYIQVNGLVTKVDMNARFIQVVYEKIPFDRIVSIEIQN